MARFSKLHCLMAVSFLFCCHVCKSVVDEQAGQFNTYRHYGLLVAVTFEWQSSCCESCCQPGKSLEFFQQIHLAAS